MRYTQVYDGEPFIERKRRFNIRCCDCGLTHKFKLRVEGRNIRFTVHRDAKKTNDARRQKKYQGKLSKLRVMTRKRSKRG